MTRVAALLGVLAAAFLLFYQFARTPSPAPVNAPTNAFSATRAMRDIEVMGSLAHPVGSAADAAVRDYLVRRMDQLGLSPRVQSAISWRAETRADKTWVWGARVDNVIGVLRGRDPSLPAIALMAHHDSVPGSPGAADDTTGVADALEIVRAIKASGQPERDVMLIITDGEEVDLNGAVAFFKIDPAAAHVGFVFNLEARGGGGRAAMFETGPGNGAAVRTFLATSKRAVANSLAVFIYKQLPNDTDYTVAKAAGIPGLNFAFIGREFDYHSPSSTVAALDQGSVQQMGDEVLGPARAMANAPVLPARTPDLVYGNLIGDLAVAYPAWGGWIILLGVAVAILLLVMRARAASEFDWASAAQGFGSAILVLAASALTLHLTRRLTGVGFGWIAGRALLARFPHYETAIALAGLGAVLALALGLARGPARLAGVLAAIAAAVAAFLAGGFDGVALAEAGVVALLSLVLLGRPANLTGIWLGLLAAALLIALGLQIAAPTTALVIAWPLVAGVVTALLLPPRQAPPWRWAAALAVMIVSAAWCGALIHSLLEAMDLPELSALPIWLATLSLWPLLWPARRGAGGALAAVAIAAGFAIALWLHFTSPWSARHPEAVEPLYIADGAAGRAWRASGLGLDRQSGWLLTAGKGAIPTLPIPTFRTPFPVVPAPFAPSPSPAFDVTKASDGTVTLHVTMDPRTHLRLELRPETAMAAVTLEHQPAPWLLRPGALTHLEWHGAKDLTIAFRPKTSGALEIRYAASTPGWPAGIKPPSLPPTMMAWDEAGASLAIGQKRLSW